MSNNVTPLLGPFLALLKSRKVLVALATVLIDTVIVLVPELEPYRVELVSAVTAVGSVLIGSIAHEDANKGFATIEGSAELVEEDAKG